MRKIYTIAPGTEEERQVAIEPLAQDNGARRYRLTFDCNSPEARSLEVDAHRLPSGAYSLLVEGGSHDIDVHRHEDTWTLSLDGRGFERRVLDERRMRMLKASGKGVADGGPALEAPMAGKVIALLVEPGEEIEVDTPVMIVEAMKMENVLKSHRAGVVSAIKVVVGEAVDVNQVLLVIDDLASKA